MSHWPLLSLVCRSQRNEELALSQENLIIPPDYFEAVAPKPAVPVNSHRQLVNTESQTTFDTPPPRRMDSATQATRPVGLHRLASVCIRHSLTSNRAQSLLSISYQLILEWSISTECGLLWRFLKSSKTSSFKHWFKPSQYLRCAFILIYVVITNLSATLEHANHKEN